MNNTTITIGNIDLSWPFTKCQYKCKCVKKENMDAFDRVICGLLYKKGGFMPKHRMASLIGFNISSQDPTDYAEKCIFELAISSLIKYGLLEEDSQILNLTEKGNKSYENRTKEQTKELNVEVWYDQYTGITDTDLVQSLSLHPICSEEPQNLNPDEIVSETDKFDVINSRIKEEGTSVISIIDKDVEHYVVNLKCKVCYDIETKECSIIPETEHDEFNKVLLTNVSLREKLIEKFFDEKYISVIYKPSHQRDMEELLLNHRTLENNNLHLISCEEHFYSEMNKGYQPIMYFSFSKLTENIKNKLCNLSCDFICVDYVESEFEDCDSISTFSDGSICFNRVSELRTLDFCVSKSAYYTILPFVVNYKGINYSINLVYSFNDLKYDYSSLYAPFFDFVSNRLGKIVRDDLLRMKRTPSVEILNKMKIFQAFIDEIGLKQTNSKGIIEEVYICWRNYIEKELDSIGSEALTAEQDKETLLDRLNKIVSKISESLLDKEFETRIGEIRQRIEGNYQLKRPTVVAQTRYILDTCVFMERPSILDKFDIKTDKIVIPRAMEQELDGLKHDSDKSKSGNASDALKQIRQKIRDYPQFISIKDNIDKSLLPNGFDPMKRDNDMLAVAIELERQYTNSHVFIVSDDKELLENINDCHNSNIISDEIVGISSDELLRRLQD